MKKAHACKEAIGYTFHNPILLWEAIQAEGSIHCIMASLGAKGRLVFPLQQISTR